MKDLISNPAFIALVGTLFGGAGLKVVERSLQRGANKRERNRDYRAEIAELVERMDKVEQELDFWKRRYYEEQADNYRLRYIMLERGIEPPVRVVVPPDDTEPRPHI